MTTYPFMGYEIPVRLIEKTGAGPETFEAFAAAHMEQLERYTPVAPTHQVLEIGCGIGRDAIPLTAKISDSGRYDGVDIDRESIAWCRQNISARCPRFHFHHLDVRSQLYNPQGRHKTTQVRLPAANATVDRAIAQSLFTHLLEKDALHYLRELARVLKPQALGLATFFIADEGEIEISKSNPVPFFRFPYARGKGCYVNDEEHPEGSVAYTPEALGRLLDTSGLVLDQPIRYGNWLGHRQAAESGQDVVILKRAG